MINHSAICLLLLLSAPVLADDDSDAVNERIPVSPAEMEAHWQVDCAGTWESLRVAAAKPASAGNCTVAVELAHELQLCAFIYQAPAAHSEHRCPDYRGALDHLQNAGGGQDCARLFTSILQTMDCRGPEQ